MPAVGHVLQTLLAELLDLLSPSEEYRLIRELAGLVVSSCHLEQYFISQLAREPSDLPQLLIGLLDHRKLKPVFFPL